MVREGEGMAVAREVILMGGAEGGAEREAEAGVEAVGGERGQRLHGETVGKVEGGPGWILLPQLHSDMSK